MLGLVEQWLGTETLFTWLTSVAHASLRYAVVGVLHMTNLKGQLLYKVTFSTVAASCDWVLFVLYNKCGHECGLWGAWHKWWSLTAWLGGSCLSMKIPNNVGLQATSQQTAHLRKFTQEVNDRCYNINTKASHALCINATFPFNWPSFLITWLCLKLQLPFDYM